MAPTVADQVDTALRDLERDRLLPPEREWIGCTDDQLAEIESRFARRLSTAHRWFLQRVGRTEARLFLGSYAFWPHVMELVEGTDELLADNGHPPLADDAVPVLLHQGYIAFWTIGTAEDPPVWRFNEGTTVRPEPAYASFSEWLLRLGREWALID